MNADDPLNVARPQTPQDEFSAWIWVCLYAATAIVLVVLEIASAAWLIGQMWKSS